MSKAEKLIELTKRKAELFKEISELDLVVAKKKDEYRKIIIEINAQDKHYFADTKIH